MKQVIAIDLGASNGRVIVFKLEKEQLELKEIHRFSNNPITKGNHLFWDISLLMNEIKKGLKRYVLEFGDSVDGIGIDTWGVDFGFISTDGSLLENPYSYRDTHTNEIMDRVHKKISARDLFNRTGVEPASINTIYQLAAILIQRPSITEKLSEIVTMPSLIGYLLTGEKYNEFTHASTTQLLDLENQNWDQDLIEKILARKLPIAEIKETNTIVGYTSKEITKETGLAQSPVINVPGHDTACALVAMPLQSYETVFMSCGTWVLIGIEVNEPITMDSAYEWGFTNEGTVEGTYRFQKNNMGLWLLQQCKKEWEENGESISYSEESELLMNSEPFQSLIDPDHQMFFNPPSMTTAIHNYCKETNQSIPKTKGEFIRCIIESLALKYRWVIERIEMLTQKEISNIHMGGGGIQNKWLCQFTANATHKFVQAGPIESSSVGNALSQFMALGVCKNLQEAREISTRSFSMKEYHPMEHDEWNDAYQKFIKYL